MIIEILYAGLLQVKVVPHREGNVLSLGLTHYDGTHQVGFLDIDDVKQLYFALGDTIMATGNAEEERRQQRVNAFLSSEGDLDDSDN